MPAPFAAALKQKLHPQAYSKKRLIRLNRFHYQPIHLHIHQLRHSVPKGAHPRQNHMRRLPHHIRIPGDHRLAAQIFKGFLHTAQIPHPIINHRDHTAPPAFCPIILDFLIIPYFFKKSPFLYFALHSDLKGGLLMVTWLDLFTFCLVIIGVVSLVIQAYKKK
jgi:hypothetical protein